LYFESDTSAAEDEKKALGKSAPSDHVWPASRCGQFIRSLQNKTAARALTKVSFRGGGWVTQ
jgi:hypothetical protein